MSSGDGYVLWSAVGQTDAGRLAGGGYQLEGGVLATGESGVLFCDGFESGDTSAWSSATP